MKYLIALLGSVGSGLLLLITLKAFGVDPFDRGLWTGITLANVASWIVHW